MSTDISTYQKDVLWRGPPRRGLDRVHFHCSRLGRAIRDRFLSNFICMLGYLAGPGMRPVGILQTAALRLMGVRCAGSNIWIGPNVRIHYPENLILGDRITLAGDTHITAHAPVEIGDDFLAAPGLYINTGTHDLATLVPESSPVVIGPGVWCGARVTLCAGVTIGAGAIVGAGSVVVRDLPGKHVSVGVPCKPVRDISTLRRDTTALWSNFH
ncbi:MAG TPA: hypothetical protein VIM44_08470 [Rariglobus sp.]